MTLLINISSFCNVTHQVIQDETCISLICSYVVNSLFCFNIIIFKRNSKKGSCMLFLSISSDALLKRQINICCTFHTKAVISV